MDSILTIIPAYNESAHIRAVVEVARRQLPVLVVDDGSTDQTASLAEASGASVLRQVPNQGKGAALRAGFNRALELGYAAVVMLDGDGQHDPLEISTFLAAYSAQPADLIIGKRNFSTMPPSRRFANTLGGWMFQWAMGQPIPDNQSGFRLLSRRMMQALLQSAETGFEFEVEMIVTCITCGYSLGWVPIRTIYAGETSHIRPGRHILNYFRVVWQARQKLRQRRTRPLPEK